jgi:hypothetical protein
MPSNDTSLGERVSASYSRLFSVATDLNAVSDELGKSVSDIDSALKKLNLGISAWVEVRAGSGNLDRGDDSYWHEDIGYAKISGKWGISLRKVDGNYTDEDDERVESWLFNDAPRFIRLAAIDKIPKLIDMLSNEAVNTAMKLRDRLADAQSISVAVKGAASQLTSPAVKGFVVKGAKEQKQ